jgi:hypothetical protein
MDSNKGMEVIFWNEKREWIKEYKKQLQELV